MRMWMVDPRFMCDRHLLGEHYECHMFAGCIDKKKTLSGYIAKQLFDPASLTSRHNQLVKEMKSRGFSHHSPSSITNATDRDNGAFTFSQDFIKC